MTADAPRPRPLNDHYRLVKGGLVAFVLTGLFAFALLEAVTGLFFLPLFWWYFAFWHWARAKGRAGWYCLWGCWAPVVIAFLRDRSDPDGHPLEPPRPSLSAFLLDTWARLRQIE